MPGETDVTTVTSSTTDPTGEKAAEPIEASKAPENAIPYARFKEVNEPYQQYKRFGSPQEVEQQLSQLAYYRELERQALEEANQNKDGKPDDKTAKELEEAKGALYKIEPRLARAIEAGDEVEANRLARVILAEDATRALLKANGQEDTQENMESWAEALKPFITKNKVVRAWWQINPERAVELAYKAWQEKMSPQIERQLRVKQEQDKQPLSKLPKAPAPTGSPPTGKAPTEIRTMKDAEKSVTAKLARGLEV